MASEQFTETTGSIAREARVLPETVRSYADRKLIEFIRLDNGTRLFKPSAAAQVKAIRAQQRRGGHREAAPVR